LLGRRRAAGLRRCAARKRFGSSCMAAGSTGATASIKAGMSALPHSPTSAPAAIPSQSPRPPFQDNLVTPAHEWRVGVGADYQLRAVLHLAVLPLNVRREHQLSDAPPGRRRRREPVPPTSAPGLPALHTGCGMVGPNQSPLTFSRQPHGCPDRFASAHGRGSARIVVADGDTEHRRADRLRVKPEHQGVPAGASNPKRRSAPALEPGNVLCGRADLRELDADLGRPGLHRYGRAKPELSLGVAAPVPQPTV